MTTKIDWNVARRDFICDRDGPSFRRIARKNKVSRPVLQRHAKRGNWMSLRQQFQSSVEPLIVKTYEQWIPEATNDH